MEEIWEGTLKYSQRWLIATWDMGLKNSHGVE
jgi:hypothetical protein